MGSNCPEFKKFYTFLAINLDYTNNTWQFLHVPKAPNEFFSQYQQLALNLLQQCQNEVMFTS